MMHACTCFGVSSYASYVWTKLLVVTNGLGLKEGLCPHTVLQQTILSFKGKFWVPLAVVPKTLHHTAPENHYITHICGICWYISGPTFPFDSSG